jgi:hypothetical protein
MHVVPVVDADGSPKNREDKKVPNVDVLRDPEAEYLKQNPRRVADWIPSGFLLDARARGREYHCCVS